MAYVKTYCANSTCPKHTKYTGGRFVYSSEKRAFFCEDCFHVPMVLNSAKNLWEFTTTHFTGYPVHVKDLAHLRQLEKEHGCSSHAANNMESNWSVPPPVKPWSPPKELRDFMR
jgi:hypothetical protein